MANLRIDDGRWKLFSEFGVKVGRGEMFMKKNRKGYDEKKRKSMEVKPSNLDS
ncbi:hypothetical protein RUM43_010509, partial [Polyplax serrata]